MGYSLLALAVLIAGILALYAAQSSRLRRLAMHRAGLPLEDVSPLAAVLAIGDPAGRTYQPRHLYAAPAAALLTGMLVFWVFALPLQYAFSFGILIGVIVYLLEVQWAGARTQKIEAQLADAIDLMVASIRAGSALLAAFEAALREARMPIREELQTIIAHIRLGEDPRHAVQELAIRVPLESFRLFTHCLLVHWETGGSLASSLRVVSKTVRDRIEVSRRISAQAVESQISVVAVMAISYGLTVLRLNTAPVQTKKLLLSEFGAWMAAGVILLQAFGIAWIWRMSRIRF
jgi:tight adherence protein B